jgi:hypothetical protein
MMYNMKQYIAVASMVLIAVLAATSQGVAGWDHATAGSAAPGEKSSQLSSNTVSNDVPSQFPIVAPSASASPPDVRDVPSISGRYLLGGKTLLPYLGAGFSGGYGSEFNRSLGGEPPASSDLGLRNQFGQGVSPNEFQLGVRIPF